MFLNKITLVILLTIPWAFRAYSQKTSNYSPENTPPKQIEGMQLVWFDEFNEDGIPNPTNWNYEKGFVRNKELQWYQANNAFCKNGVLVIEGRREQKVNPGYDSVSTNWKMNRKHAEYTSSSLKTQGKHSWKYGRFEIRARIDTSCGLWPAIWTLGIEGEWPQNGEIDIMEFYRIKNEPHILANFAWGTEQRWVAQWDEAKIPYIEIIKNDTYWHKKFHIWQMDWNHDSISLYLDDRLLNTTQLNDCINPDGTQPFQQQHYIILNLAIGGNGGDPSNTTFPVRYEIDYVRVYQKVGK
jgi:beta-glucanase (GH16 family)